MKKKLIYLYLILIIFSFSSCFQKSKSIVITDFSQPIVDTLIPNKKGPYTTALFEIKGNSNDTIKIKFHGIEKKFIGNFEKKMNMDYYGGNVIFEFESYKATRGKLEIKYGIY